jgi:hypothetical protein
VTIDKSHEIWAIEASGGKMLGVMRYVLGVCLMLDTMVGVILWNIHATH